MIRAGRDVINKDTIGQLHGMTPATAARRKPWSADGHPAPVYNHKLRLWDREQAEAHALGKPIPTLPEVDSPDDLLDLYEAAALLGLNSNSWRTGRSRDTFPRPDVPEDKHGAPFWLRSTVEEFDRTRKTRSGYNPAGRPKGIAQAQRADAAELEKKIRAILDEHAHAGTTPRQIDIAQQLNVNVRTVRNHLKAIHEADAATPRPRQHSTKPGSGGGA
ncbi:hypothetical protein [Lentzea sp. CA-135723]|uniref:hypothetical protein n=1 Tax=Lentzea sp. CA-135723 TaxID=3239950 RepID=UPI003D9276E9